jgi:hypothetical protein
MTENTPPTLEEIRQLNRALMERVLNRAASDPEWKQRLLDDPEAAILEAGFPEAKKLQEAQALSLSEEAEVSGHIFPTVPCVTSFRLGPNHTDC